MNKVTIAAVEAKTTLNAQTYKMQNLAYALGAIKEAKQHNAHIICFPETFPGPRLEKDIEWDPHGELATCARENDIYVIYGRASKVPGDHSKQYLTEVLIGPDGKTVGSYHRTCPPGPWIYREPGRTFWDLNYTTEDELPVFSTDIGKIGLLVCSEVYVPELCRILALKGAEITFMPAGLPKGNLYKTWKHLLRARAIENLMYTVSCDNIVDDQQGGGMCIIAGPEGELADAETEGIIYMDADLERVRWLRGAVDSTSSTYQSIPYYTKPSLLTEWRRPEVFALIVNTQDEK